MVQIEKKRYLAATKGLHKSSAVHTVLVKTCGFKQCISIFSCLVVPFFSSFCAIVPNSNCTMRAQSNGKRARAIDRKIGLSQKQENSFLGPWTSTKRQNCHQSLMRAKLLIQIQLTFQVIFHQLLPQMSVIPFWTFLLFSMSSYKLLQQMLALKNKTFGISFRWSK